MAAAEDRPFSSLVQDIIGSVREIIRLELRLARAEVAESLSAMRSAVIVMVIGALALVVAAELFVVSALFALATVMPPWVAALVLAGVAVLAGIICLVAGKKFLAQVQPPKRTIASVQEGLPWPTTQTR